MTTDLTISAKNAPSVQAAARVLGKVSTRQFTDSLQRFESYVDPAGNPSSSKGAIYPANFKKLLRAFGMSADQAKAKLEGESLRESLDMMTLNILAMAEFEVANTIDRMIEGHALRKEINQAVTSIFEKWAAHLRHLTVLAG